MSQHDPPHRPDPLDGKGGSTFWNDGNGERENKADAYWHIAKNIDGRTPNFDKVVSKSVGIISNNGKDTAPLDHSQGFTLSQHDPPHRPDPLDGKGGSTFWNDGNGERENKADAYWHVGHNQDGRTPNFNKVVSKSIGIISNNGKDTAPTDHSQGFTLS